MTALLIDGKALAVARHVQRPVADAGHGRAAQIHKHGTAGNT